MDIMKGLYAAVLTCMLVLSGCLHEQTEAGMINRYDADDAADTATSGTSDTLIRLQMSGDDSLSWTSTNIRLSVDDAIYGCSLGGADECQITQQGGDDGNVWEPGEYIFLSESGTDICNDIGCRVDISVTYRDNTVSGDSSIIVS